MWYNAFGKNISCREKIYYLRRKIYFLRRKIFLAEKNISCGKIYFLRRKIYFLRKKIWFLRKKKNFLRRKICLAEKKIFLAEKYFCTMLPISFRRFQTRKRAIMKFTGINIDIVILSCISFYDQFPNCAHMNILQTRKFRLFFFCVES